MSRRSILVLTGLHPMWQAEDNITFIGPWCLERPHMGLSKEFRPAASFKTCPFHWGDRDKLKKDYDYLEALHKKLLACLAVDLNRFHKTHYTRRYWQILLDPWLMSYVGVMFDRWETVRLALAGGGEFCVPTSESRRNDATRVFSYNDFISGIITDAGNEAVFRSILQFQYSERIQFQGPTNTIQSRKGFFANFQTTPFSIKRILKQITTLFDSLTQFLTFRNKFVFQDAYFTTYPFIRLSLALGQIPKFWHSELDFNENAIRGKFSGEENAPRTIDLSWTPENQFESFLASRLRRDLPMCVIEYFNKMGSIVTSLSVAPEVIITGNNHWSNPLSKAWMAEHTARGGKLVILEHGGSFPARKELFNFEEDIADWKGTWFVPYHPKHVQVPPSKLIRARAMAGYKSTIGKNSKYCLIIGNENPKYVYRAMFYPMADQCLKSLSMVNQMINSFLPTIREMVRIRPYPKNMGWNCRALYAEAHGEKKILSSGTLQQAFISAKIIVCTYPETTFSEAMATGRPVILLYLADINERHPVAFQLIDIMRKAKIIFHDSKQAADHINKIWDNPFLWWNSEEVVDAREAFRSQAGRINKKWLAEWKDLLLQIQGNTI